VLCEKHWKLSLNYASTSVGNGSFPHLWKLQSFMVRVLSSKSSSVAMKAHKYPANPSTLISGYHWLQVVLRGAAALTWITFILFCIGSAISFGLCCADDGAFALVAKSLAHGYGYSTHFFPEGSPPQFNHGITTGPTLILPCALMLMLFGDHEVIPGLVAIMLWGATFTFLFERISRRVTNASLFAGVAVFCLSITTIFVFQFGQWHAFLGEVTAAAFLILAHWILAMETLSPKWLFLGGLCVGLATQAKNLALLGGIGVLIALAVRLRSRHRLPEVLAYPAILFAGCILPTLLFESWKIIDLGIHGYLANWRAFFVFAKAQGVGVDRGAFLHLAGQRLGVIRDTFSIDPLAYLFVVVLSLGTVATRFSRSWIILACSVYASVFVWSVYWICFSIGWARYFDVAALMGCFALTIPIFGARSMNDALLFLAVAILLVAPGRSRLPYVFHRLDHRLFASNDVRRARMKVVKKIRNLHADTPSAIFAGTWWAEFVDVEFDLQNIIIQRTDRVKQKPGPKFVLVNKHFGIPNEHDYIEKTLGAPISATRLAAGPYELLEVNSPP
jgi:hypothetical protein